MNDSEKKDSIYDSLQKKRKKIKYTSLLFALFTLGVNVFAWFVYVSSAKLQIDATVSSWDVEFMENGELTNSMLVEVSKMLPGMEPFNSSVVINNKGEVAADFLYVVDSFKLLGQEVNIDKSNLELVNNELKTRYPFVVYFNSSNDHLLANESLDFSVNVTWDYESESDIYYNLNEVYEYDANLTYYQLVDGKYVAQDVNASNFSTLRNTLYLDKNDADTYFGYKCGKYEKDSGKPCLSLDLRLIVQQKR